MIIGTVLVVFTDPVLSQQISNSRSRTTIEQQRIQSAVMAEKAAHQSRKIIHNIRLGAQRQMAIEAKKYYKSPEVQAALKQTAVDALQDVMRQSGIAVPEPSPSTPTQPKASRDFLAETGEETAATATHPTANGNRRK